MTIAQHIVARLWWGPLRRPFEALARRTVGRRARVICGPLRGHRFRSGLSKILGVYELPIQEVIQRCLSDGDVFYDVGAHTGYLSLLAAHRVGARGHVYAFEPLPQNIERVRAALSDNQVANCTLIPKAVSNTSGTAEFYLDGEGNSATSSLMARPGDHTVRVATVMLDEFVRQTCWPALIKVDVEGAEELVLEGASALLKQDPAPTWLLEVHSEENDVLVKQCLAANGYRTCVIPSLRKRRNPYPYHVLAWRPGSSGSTE